MGSSTSSYLSDQRWGALRCLDAEMIMTARQFKARGSVTDGYRRRITLLIGPLCKAISCGNGGFVSQRFTLWDLSQAKARGEVERD